MTDIRFDILARDKASAVFRGVGAEAGKTSTKMEKFHKVGAVAGVALAGGLALAGKAALDFTKKAAADQQSASRLAQTLHKTTGATKDQQAAVETWISAQEKAYGVTDDDLRPALSKLAVATGSVTKAQKLASLAMDISAGTGKSLSSVSFALAKAQNGNVSGLARLGVKTTKTTHDTVALKKAQIAAKTAQLAYTSAVKSHGKNSAEAGIASAKLKLATEAVGAAQEKTKKTTLSLGQITQNLSNQYGGAAARNAQTAAGKQKILSVQIQELQEKIGYLLIPAMLKLANVGMRVVGWIDRNTKLAGILVGSLGALLAVTVAVSAATKAWGAITVIANVATKAWAAGQWLLNAALTANPIGLVVVAIAGLVAGLVIAYKKSETFRNIVNGAFHGVQVVAAKVFGWLKNAVSATIGFVKSHWMLILGVLGGPIALAAVLIIKNFGKIKAAVSNGVSAVIGFVRSHWQLLVGLIGGPIALAAVLVIKNFGKMKAGVQAAVSAVVGFVSSIPGKITAALGNLGSLLFNAGRSVIQGLINGVESMIGSLTSKLHAITSLIPKHKGPIEKDRQLLRNSGRAIMQGLINGIDDKKIPLQNALSAVTGIISKVGAKISALQSTKAGFGSTFTADSIFGTDLSGGGGITDLIAAQTAQATQAAQLAADVKNATSRGLSKALVSQLQSQGTSGAAALHAIASGSNAQIGQLNALNKQTSASLQAAGMRAGNYVRGGSIDADIKRAQHQDRVLEKLEHTLHELAQHQKKGESIVVEIDSEAVIRAIIRRNKRKGVKSAGV